MKCPECQSRVEWLSSAVDGSTIAICSNSACTWESLPTHAPDPEAVEREEARQQTCP